MANGPSSNSPGLEAFSSALTGREEILDAPREQIRNVEGGSSARLIILEGKRGSGKTVLLDAIADMAATEYGWAYLSLRAAPDSSWLDELAGKAIDLVKVLGAKSAKAGNRAARKTAREEGQLDPSGLRLDVEREWTNLSEETRRLELAIQLLASVAKASGSGVVITIDELQTCRKKDFPRFAVVTQEASRMKYPFLIVLAGRPSMMNVTSAVGYMERALWLEVGNLD